MRRKSAILLILLSGVLSVLFYQVPRAKAVTWIGGYITSDTTWSPVDTYRIINDTYVVPGVTLAIESGVHIQLADGFSLIIQGSLNASGSEDNPIVFTSSRLSPVPGAWNSIEFQGNASEHFSLRNVRVEYAVDGVTIQSLEPVVIESSEISNCSENGILLANEANVLIRDDIIQQNKNGIVTNSPDKMPYERKDAVYSGVSITNNTIQLNAEFGIYLVSCYGQISNVSLSSNTISSNSEDGVWLFNYAGQISDVFFTSNTITSNSGKGVYLYTYYGSILNVNFTLNRVSSNNGDGICIDRAGLVGNVSFSSNVISFNGGEGVFLEGYANQICNVTISNNTILSNAGDGISLREWGIFEAPYTTICHLDVSLNAICLNGGTAISISAGGYGYWGSIIDASVSSNIIRSNGGDGISLSNSHPYEAGSSFCNVTLSSNEVWLNGGNGISLSSGDSFSNAIVSSNTISSNHKDGIYASAQHTTGSPYDILLAANTISSNHEKGVEIIRVSASSLIMNASQNDISYNEYGVFLWTINSLANHNDIYGNHYGMNVTSDATINAENNYWGETSGPYQPSLNPEGRGNPVNGNGVNLDFIPFLPAAIGYINQRPVAALSVSKKIVGINESVTFDASSTIDDGSIACYYFDYGDGTNSGWTTLHVILHEYRSVGTYYANVTVMDNAGAMSTNAEQIKVQITVIPEFQFFAILTFFLLSTLVAVILSKKKYRSTCQYFPSARSKDSPYQEIGRLQTQ